MTNLDMSLIQVNLCNTSTPCSSLPIAPPSNRSSSASRAWWSGKRTQEVKILSGSRTSQGPHPTCSFEASETGNLSKVLLAKIFQNQGTLYLSGEGGQLDKILVQEDDSLYHLCLYICICICINCVCSIVFVIVCIFVLLSASFVFV